MKCTYKKEFPVDEFGRPGALYSLADLPVVGTKVLEREGTLISQDSKKKLYQIKDDKGFTVVVPMSDVEVANV
mgnify:FL=1|jgi:hypothetical protein|tara:strand:+ start:3249 stop:3467 length:219 start_codon:yes stop_codon:yes gene_type:complete